MIVREAAGRAAVVNRRAPLAVRLLGRERAVGEIRQARVEADGGRGCALAVDAVARHAGGLVDVLAGVELQLAGGLPLAARAGW